MEIGEIQKYRNIEILEYWQGGIAEIALQCTGCKTATAAPLMAVRLDPDTLLSAKAVLRA